jgi:predicted lysophospholipase L1 biosynthesis ABC-type transport system permease subunit
VLDGRELEVVAVVRDSRYRTLDEEAMPFVYLAWRQFPARRGNLLVRSGSPEAMVPELRSLVRERAAELPISQLGPLEDQLAVSLLPQKVASAVAGALGLVGLLLTAIGLYGVLAYRVRAKSAEIGVRMSLGAEPRDVLSLILRSGLQLTLFGLLLGLPVAGLVARLLTSFLYGLSPWDPMTYGSIVAVVAVTALIASYAPARRAAGIDPLQVLRSE